MQFLPKKIPPNKTPTEKTPPQDSKKRQASAPAKSNCHIHEFKIVTVAHRTQEHLLSCNNYIVSWYLMVQG